MFLNKIRGSLVRQLSSTTNSTLKISPDFINRNPRNLERMRIGYKPDGYHLEAPGKCYWHKLKLEVSERHVSASIQHFANGDVLKVTTHEWAIKKHLYKGKDSAAFMNLGRVLADRCLKAGLTEIRCDIVPPRTDGKVALFLKAVEDGGVVLKEPPQYKPSRPWDTDRPEKPWEVTAE